MALGLKRAYDRIKKKIKQRRKGLLLASILFLFVVAGMVGWEENAQGNESEVYLDISNFCPTCKDSAYIGLDNHDYLTLYDGDPRGGNAVRRLFQLDIEFLENSLPSVNIDQLLKGIQVTDDAEYSSVLSTFSDYALDE